MKNIKKLCFLVLSLATLVSCSYEPEIGSTVTIYPVITVTGANPYFVPVGTAYTDPGATAKAGTATVPVVITAIGKYRGTTTLDTNKADEYIVTYTATNSDGFAATATRKELNSSTALRTAPRPKRHAAEKKIAKKRKSVTDPAVAGACLLC